MRLWATALVIGVVVGAVWAVTAPAWLWGPRLTPVEIMFTVSVGLNAALGFAVGRLARRRHQDVN